jgi:hypothetical protein
MKQLRTRLEMEQMIEAKVTKFTWDNFNTAMTLSNIKPATIAIVLRNLNRVKSENLTVDAI